MVISSANKKYSFIALACIYLFCWLITFSNKYHANEIILSRAILGDLLITAPVVFWLWNRKNISFKIVARIFLAGVLIAGTMLNAESTPVLKIIKHWIAPFLEIGLIFFIVRKSYTAHKAAATDETSADFLLFCRKIMHQVFGSLKAGNIISSEIAVFYYAFFSRRNKSPLQFTSYKKNGILLVLYTFLCLFLIETIGLHFIIRMWSNTAAVILTTLSIYTCIQLYAHIRAVKIRTILLLDNHLMIRNGLAGDAVIEYDNIERISGSENNSNAVKIALIKSLEKHNCTIHLKETVLVTRIFGLQKNTKAVQFFIDEHSEFSEQLKNRMHPELTAASKLQL